MEAPSVTTSIADLYRVAANPIRTNVNNIHKDEAPFVSSQNNSHQGEDEEPRLFEEDERSQQSHRSHSSRASSHHSETESQKWKNKTRTYVSRRPSSASHRVRRVQSNPFLGEERQRQKTVYLHELNRMKLAGSRLSREYTEEDNVADIEFECNRVKANEDQTSTVSFMKDAIKLGTTGLELLNNKFNILRLNGWAGEVTRDMERYNRPLGKIYQRYWRRGSVSPFVELGFLLFGSLIVHHFKNVLTGGVQNTNQIPSRPPTVAPPSRNVPFNIPQQQQPQPSPPNTGNLPKRRTMRRPKRGSPEEAPPSVQQGGMPSNLINMLMSNQTAPMFAAPSVGFAEPPPGFVPPTNGFPPAGIVGIGVVSTGTAPPSMFTNEVDSGVVVLDMMNAQRRQRKNTTELEIIDEDSSPKDDTRIDIREDKPDGTLSFDMA